MRVTRVMKTYVEKEFDAKRQEANKQFSAAYEARRKACVEEVREAVKSFRDVVDEILEKYGMDTIAPKRDKNTGYYHNEVIGFCTSYIQNAVEEKAIYAYQRKLRDYQQERLERFYLECDLGCDKEEFFKMVEALNFDNI